ncbi:MAG: sigma 54-interacting transcriptional regulator [Planctomycetota bacterium]
MMPKILVVEDDKLVREALVDTLISSGYQVKSVSDGAESLLLIQQESFNAVILDLNLPTMGGLKVLAKVKQFPNAPPVIVLTAYGSVQNAVTAMKSGAADFLVKPCPMKELKTLLRSIVSSNKIDSAERLKISDSASIVGESKVMKKVIDLVKRVARTNSDIYIYGETGTGKDMIARTIHNESKRKNKPFVKIDCAILPGELLESELFGHEAGAFTGAKERLIGKFEQAQGGTVFLDEISNLTLSAQAKLLNIIQDREFTRIGGMDKIKIDIRIVSASNKDLTPLIKEGIFREDLWYRLEVVSIVLPPLNERKEDIPMLADYFLKKFNAINHKNIKEIGPEIMAAMMNYRFPGNIRELENLILRLVVTNEGEIIRLSDLPSKITQSRFMVFDHKLSKAANLDFRSQDIDKAIKSLGADEIINALKECRGNKKKAAELLGISRMSLYNKIKQFNLALSEKKDFLINDEAEEDYKLGDSYLKTGDYQKAIELFKDALGLMPDWDSAHYLLGQAYNKIGNRKGALEEYEIIKKLNTELADKLLKEINPDSQ